MTEVTRWESTSARLWHKAEPSFRRRGQAAFPHSSLDLTASLRATMLGDESLPSHIAQRALNP